MTILDEIIAYKRNEVQAAKANTPISALQSLAMEIKPRSFRGALERKAANSFAVIAEIKKASPSKGIIRPDFDPSAHAAAYEKGGAACLSVLTDGPSFHGSPDHLKAARHASNLPIIRKDFMVDPYQVVEARAWGADCILLIMACLTDIQAAELAAAAKELGLDILWETHDHKEMERAINLNASLIGINNRNLKTFETKLERTAELAPFVPDDSFLVSESGVKNNSDLCTLRGFGAKGFLIGETLMRQPDLSVAMHRLISPARLA